jgi:serine/threonine protein kinase
MSGKMRLAQDELKTLLKLDHPFIIKYIDHFAESLVFGIVMSYCEVNI